MEFAVSEPLLGNQDHLAALNNRSGFTRLGLAGYSLRTIATRRGGSQRDSDPEQPSWVLKSEPYLSGEQRSGANNSWVFDLQPGMRVLIHEESRVPPLSLEKATFHVLCTRLEVGARVTGRKTPWRGAERLRRGGSGEWKTRMGLERRERDTHTHASAVTRDT